jgi:hypothetical protein
VDEATLTTAVVEEALEVSAVPAYRLVLAEQAAYPASRLFVLHARVKNVGDQPLDLRPAAARLLLLGGAGAVFDRPRAEELLRRTELTPIDGSGGEGSKPVRLREPVRSRLRVEILASLLDDVQLAPGAEVAGYLVTDAGVAVASLEGVVLEVFATRSADQSIVRDSYEFAVRPAPQAGGEM